MLIFKFKLSKMKTQEAFLSLERSFLSLERSPFARTLAFMLSTGNTHIRNTHIKWHRSLVSSECQIATCYMARWNGKRNDSTRNITILMKTLRLF